MKTKIYLIALLGIVIQVATYAQRPNNITASGETVFNDSYWNAYAEKLHLSPKDKLEFISSHRNDHLTLLQSQNISQKQPDPNSLDIFAGPCVNIDFENGSLNGWNPSSGFHPIYNPTGCCPAPGGQQMIMTGAGLDPAGNFPVVAPGGNFSLRLGNNINGGQADRIEQTFMVSPANANFTYRYAVVFQDPGHVTAEQPSFQIEMRDSLGGQVPCTFYNVAAGNNIPGFMNSLSMPGVIYKPWTNVMVDLSNYIGQNITIRFTTYDCALGGHYGYAYIDGSCQAFVTGGSHTICAGGTKNFCAPNGLGSYTWNGPGIINNTSQCINATAPGIYTCNTTLVTNCTGPQFTYTLSHFPQPAPSFSFSTANACSQQYSFTNTSNILSGLITSFNWNFGGGNTSNAQHPFYNFPATGTFSVNLSVTSNKGCIASTSQTINIYPSPNAAFTAPNTCQNSPVNFTNNSSVISGSIVSNNWNFGNGNTSVLLNPVHTYSINGTFTAQLNVTSDQGCVSTATGQIVIHPLPKVLFTSLNVCEGNSTPFTNQSNIPQGSITSYSWDFDNNGQPNSNALNPVHLYPASGIYTTVLTAISDNNCVNSYSSAVNVFANPTASFTAENVCFGQNTSFTNQSFISNGQILNWAWNLGNGVMTSQLNPIYNYSVAGNYIVNLSVLASNGCNSSYTSTVTVHHLPTVNFNSTKACVEQSTQFNNTTIINTGTITQWKWDFENDGIWDDTISTNPSKVYPGSGAYLCKMQALSNFNCVSEKINNVIVYANPVANFTNKPACLGDVSTFSNTSTSSDGAIVNYLWDFNGDNEIDNVSLNPSYTYTSNGIYLLRLEVQTEYGCVNVKSKSMYVNPRPNVIFSAPTRNACPDFCVTFTNSSTIATGSIINAFWQFGDGSPTEANMNSPTHCYKSGNYDVSLMLVSDSGCRSTASKAAYITVYPKPLAGFKTEPDEIDENSPVINVTSSAVGANNVSYLINDNSYYQTVNFEHTFKNIDKVNPLIVQMVKNQYGCADTFHQKIKVKPSFVIYVPNSFTPNGDGINDGWFAKGVGVIKYNMQVFDRWGHIIFETVTMDQEWDGKTRGSTEPIKQDVYVWRAVVQDVFNKNHELTGTVTLLK